MKKFLMFICAVTLVFGMVGVAGAIPYSDTYNANHIFMSGPWGQDASHSITWTFDITDDGFNPVTQDVTSASVGFNFEDDEDQGMPYTEWAYLNVGMNHFVWNVNMDGFSATISSLMSLSDFGTVDATLTAVWGDFYFNSATLSAIGTEDPSGDDAPAPVPEPSTILLMGTGILGLVAYGRKRYNKKA